MRIETSPSMESEHAALLEAVGLLDEGDRRIVRVAGERARRMVDGLVTNRLAVLEEGRAVYAFVLTPKGRPVAELRVLPAPPAGEPDSGSASASAELWLDVPDACLRPLLEHLGKYLPPIYARFSLDEERRRLALVGPRAAGALARAAEALGWAWDGEPAALAPLQVAEPRDAGAERAPRLVRREPPEGPGFDLYLDAETRAAALPALRAAVEAEGGGPVGAEAREVLRVERGVPRYGAEIDLEVLPQETGQEERAIHFEKGCYTGQEVVARIHYRGKVNRLLRGLAFDLPGAFDLPTGAEGGLTGALIGAELRHESRAVGRVTSAVRSPRFGPIGLGYVRREVEPGTRLALELAGEGAAAEGRPEAAPDATPEAAPDATPEAAGEAAGDAMTARVVTLPFT